MMNPSLPPFFGLQQPPAMYSYGSPLDNLAALQRDAAGIHTLVGAAATAAAAANQPNAAAVVGHGGNQQHANQSAAKSAAVKVGPSRKEGRKAFLSLVAKQSSRHEIVTVRSADLMRLRRQNFACANLLQFYFLFLQPHL
jgi:hypothetical protein